jgi:hypothetical protein
MKKGEVGRKGWCCSNLGDPSEREREGKFGGSSLICTAV